jgi:hypothetical protein
MNSRSATSCMYIYIYMCPNLSTHYYISMHTATSTCFEAQGHEHTKIYIVVIRSWYLTNIYVYTHITTIYSSNK